METWKMVVVFRNTDSEERTVNNKYRLKALLNSGYEIVRHDCSDGMIVYVLER